MVAEARDFLARKLARLQHGGAVRNFDLFAVYGNFGHSFEPSFAVCERSSGA
jgi:hypothetical protein